MTIHDDEYEGSEARLRSLFAVLRGHVEVLSGDLLERVQIEIEAEGAPREPTFTSSLLSFAAESANLMLGLLGVDDRAADDDDTFKET